MKFNFKAPPRKTIIRASAIASVCSLLFVGGAYALFSGSVTTGYHLEAGTLEVGLERTSYSTYALNDTGVMEEATDVTPVDLTADDSQLFDIAHAVPTSRYEATLTVTNRGDASFDYSMKILWDKDSAEGADLAMAQQTEITISGGDLTEPVVFRLADAPTENINLGRLFAGDTAQEFTITAEFVDCPENNQARGADLGFDVTVTATQHTS